MNWSSRDRWVALWKAAGATEAPAQWYERLTAAYAEPQRYYHNQQHIAECVAEFDQAQHLARQPAAVELALWFHDAVYDPKAGDNEEQSAALAQRCFAEAGTSDSLAAAVANLVMATKSHEVGADSDRVESLVLAASINGSRTWAPGGGFVRRGLRDEMIPVGETAQASSWQP